MEIKWKSCLKVGGSVFLLYLCIHYWETISGLVTTLIGAAAPLLIGCVIAYAVNILMSFYERHYFTNSKKKAVDKSRRPVCMLGAFVSLIAVVVLVGGLVVPEFVACVQLLIEEVPDAVMEASIWLEEKELLSEDVVESLKSANLEEKAEQLLATLSTGVGNMMGTVVGAVSSVFSGIVNFVLGLIFAIYLLSGKEKLGQQSKRVMKHYLKESWCKKITYVLSVANDCFHRYIVGQCTEAVILGVLCTVGMLLLGLPYATMIGALVALTALIPVAGAYIGAGVGAFMILTVSPVQAIIFLVYIVVLQQLEGNLIYPRVVGSSMGLPAIWVLTAVTIGGGVMGIPGMLLGVPLMATVYRLVKEDMKK